MGNKYTISRYVHDAASNDSRSEVKNNSRDILYILSVAMGGSGLQIDELSPGGSWREGADELIGVYETYAEAEQGSDKYMKSRY